MRFVLTLLLVLMSITPLWSQQQQPEPLVVPFTNVPPFMQLDANGARSGFIVELSELIGEEIGVPIAYLNVANSREFIGAQVSGETQMIAGVLKLPPLAPTNVFSDQVAADTLRPAILSENKADFEANGLVGRRIGVVPPAEGSEEPVLDQNFRVEFESPQAAIMGLLAKNVDAVLMPPPVVYDLARDARVDGRITFFGPALRNATRHIALHESRADLLEPINAAVGKMTDDGRLAALLRKYSLSVPEPAPEVLKIGITDLPPFSRVDSAGRYSGFSVDALSELTERSGIQFEYVELPVSTWVQGPVAAGVDAISMLVDTPERQETMYFTFPIFERTTAVVIDADRELNIDGLSALANLRVGAIAGSVFESRARAAGLQNVATYATNDELIAAHLSSAIDASLFPITIAEDVLKSAAAIESFKIVPIPGETIKSAIALRPGLGSIRDQLNGVITGYLLSPEYSALRQKYFGEPVFWTRNRVVTAISIFGVATLLMVLMFIRQRIKLQEKEADRQRRALESERAHTKQLSDMVAKLEKSNRELDEFAYIASHDLKEPLRGIGITANFLLREDLSERARQRALRMQELAGRMENLTADLFAFSRLSQENGPRSVVSPKQVIEDIRSELAEWLTEQGGRIAEVSEFPSVLVDKVRLKVVLRSLIVNAIKYNDSDDKWVKFGFATEVVVNGRKLNNAIFATDNGIGIDDIHHDKIFRIFSRLNKAVDYGSGTGSGLAFARKIVEGYGGVLDFESVKGQGSTFWFTLPLANDEGHVQETGS